MKICYLSKTYFKMRGGIETYVGRISQELASLGHEVHIITEANNDNKKLHKNNKIIIHKIDASHVPRGFCFMNRWFPLSDVWYAMQVAKKVKELVKKYGLELVESPDWLFEGLFLVNNKDIPLVVKLHGHNSIFNYYVHKKRPGSLALISQLKLESLLVRKADAVSSVSAYYADLISKLWHINKKKIKVLSNGVLDELVSCDKDGFFKKNIDPFVLFVGRIGRAKGVETLIKVFRIIWEEFPRIRVVLIGDQEPDLLQDKEFLIMINKFKSDDRVDIYSALSFRNLKNFYQNCLFLICPSLFENLSTVAQEAMVFGKPVVASNVGGFLEIIENDVNGMLVPVNDVKAFVLAIKKLICDGELREKMGSNARKLIIEKFSVNKIAEESLLFYKNAIHVFKKKECYEKNKCCNPDV